MNSKQTVSDSELRERYLRLYSGAVNDILRFDYKMHAALPSEYQPLNRDMKLCGRAFTIKGAPDITTDGEFEMRAKMLEELPPESIVMWDCTGDTVTAQVPAQGASVPGGSTVILYLGEEPAETGTVPDVRGLSYDAAKQRLENAGFFMRSSGYSASARVQSQSVAGGESAAIGTVIDVQFAATQVDDGYVSVG